MAKPLLQKPDPESEGKADAPENVHRLSNRFDADKLIAQVVSIEATQAEIEAIMNRAREQCAPLRDDIKQLKADAREIDGIPSKELNAVLRKRKILRQADAIREKLEEDQQDIFDDMEHALGQLSDLPLGQSALNGTRG